MTSIGSISSFRASFAAQQSRAGERLASGKRINRAADDPGGLAVALALSTQSRSKGVDIRSLSDGISAANIAAGALSGVQEINGRQQELAAQAANGTLSQAQREALDLEYRELEKERARIAATTEFNGQKLLDGSTSISFGGDSSANVLQISAVQQAGGSLLTAGGARQALEATATSAEALSQVAASIGQFTARAEVQLETNQASRVALSEAGARIEDQDIAEAAASLAQSIVQGNVSVALQAQAGNLSASNAAVLLT